RHVRLECQPPAGRIRRGFAEALRLPKARPGQARGARALRSPERANPDFLRDAVESGAPGRPPLTPCVSASVAGPVILIVASCPPRPFAPPCHPERSEGSR